MPITTIPFSGFYNSLHDGALDDALEQAFRDDSGDVQNPDILYKAMDAVDWCEVHNEYAQEYAENFAHEFKIKLRFESMKSPREYNFTTDIIYCEIEPGEVARIFAECDKLALSEFCADMFTSRDGFISFYSADWETWGDVNEWDHNQLGALIRAYIGSDFDQWAEYGLMENAQSSGSLDNIIFGSNPTVLNRLCKINRYLIERAER